MSTIRRFLMPAFELAKDKHMQKIGAQSSEPSSLKSESVNELVLEVNRYPATRLAMLHEAGERKLEVDTRLKELNERMDRLVA